ncbi:MAG: DNA polymerase III subunit delta [Bacillota bacterium]|nr:DNA polymerase III subunit delta [Bacillota bacterium]
MAKVTRSRTTIGYNELKAEIRQQKWQRLYVLGGEETFLIDKLIEALTELLVNPSSLSLDRLVLYGSGRSGRLDPGQLRAEVMTPPFMSRAKLVVVRQSGWFGTAGSGRGKGAGSSDDAVEDAETDDETTENIASARNTARDRQAFLIELLDHLPDCVCLVFVEQKIDRRLKSLVQAIERNGVLAEFEKEQPRILQRWIDAEGKRRKLQIDPEAAESLIDRCEGSMQVIWQELTKLFLYCDATGDSRVTRDLIDALSLPDLHGTIFDMTDALAEGKAGRALELTDVLISQKQPVQLIQFMLARHLRQLICASDLGNPGAIASGLKVPPFVAGRLAQQCRKLTPELLEQLYASCFAMDVKVKSGLITDRLALETLLVESATTITKAKRR